MLFGASGCEFEKIAAFIHHASDRSNHTFVRQRCFHWQDSVDPLRAVGTGTLFVEGIQHASLPVQLRLVSELDEAKLVGKLSDGVAPVPPRIIASANEDLYSLVENGLLLEDLHWQLCALSLRIPSLAERAEDIPAIAQQMLNRTELLHGASASYRLSDAGNKILQNYCWPGNYRQLQSVLQRAVALASGEELEIDQADIDHCAVHWQSQRVRFQLADTPPIAAAEIVTATGHPSSENASVTGSGSEGVNASAIGKSVDINQLIQAVVDKGIVEAERAHRESHSFVVDRVEKALIAAVLAKCGNVQKAAAQKLGMNRNTLHKKIKDYGLE
jgi:DNA-binding NtrC family response regulator